MRYKPSLRDELHRLKSLDDAKRRGYEFQPFVGSMFRSAHFTVMPNPGAGGSRQVDLMVTMGDESYLVETKWWSKRLSSAEIASLEDRLARTPSSVVGLLVGYSGFTPEAIQRVEQNAGRPILLVTGEELERAVEWDGEFVRMLRQKHDAMLVHSKTVFMSSRPRRPRRQPKDALPSASETFVFRDGSREEWLACGGDFGQFTFVREIPDIDWVLGSGFGVSLDVDTSTSNEAGLIALLHDLSNMGWLTGDSHWSIQQATTNWHGAGADTFAAVLTDWKRRYAGVDRIHHTEEFCYADRCDDLGFYTLTGQVAAHSPRTVWRASLSFQLSGIPVDPKPLRHLCNTFDAGASFFRPRRKESVTRHHLSPEESVVLEVVGFIGEGNELESGPKDREWAVGVLARNPFRAEGSSRKDVPRWWPDMAADSELILCSLRSWHPISRPKETYRLWSCESAWTSDGLVFRPVADWDDVQDDEMEELVPGSRQDKPPPSIVVVEQTGQRAEGCVPQLSSTPLLQP